MPKFSSIKDSKMAKFSSMKDLSGACKESIKVERELKKSALSQRHTDLVISAHEELLRRLLDSSTVSEDDNKSKPREFSANFSPMVLTDSKVSPTTI